MDNNTPNKFAMVAFKDLEIGDVFIKSLKGRMNGTVTRYEKVSNTKCRKIVSGTHPGITLERALSSDKIVYFLRRPELHPVTTQNETNGTPTQIG